MQHIYEEIGWYLASRDGSGSSRGGLEATTAKNALPSYVRLLDLVDFCAYSTTGEHARIARDIDTRGILDHSRVTRGGALVGPNHGLTVGRVGPMLVVDVLRGGIGLVAIVRTEHDCRARGRGGRVGKWANRSGDRRRGMEPKWSHNHGSFLCFRQLLGPAIPRIRFRRLIARVFISGRSTVVS